MSKNFSELSVREIQETRFIEIVCATRFRISVLIHLTHSVET